MPKEHRSLSKSEDQHQKAPWSKPRIRIMNVAFTRSGTGIVNDELIYDPDDAADSYMHDS